MALAFASSSSSSAPTAFSGSSFPFSSSSSELKGDFTIIQFHFVLFSWISKAVRFCSVTLHLGFSLSVTEISFFFLCLNFQLHKSVRSGYWIRTALMLYPELWTSPKDGARSSRSTPNLNGMTRLSLLRQRLLPLVSLCVNDYQLMIKVIIMVVCTETHFGFVFESCRSGGEGRGGGLWAIG